MESYLRRREKGQESSEQQTQYHIGTRKTPRQPAKKDLKQAMAGAASGLMLQGDESLLAELSERNRTILSERQSNDYPTETGQCETTVSDSEEEE